MTITIMDDTISTAGFYQPHTESHVLAWLIQNPTVAAHVLAKIESGWFSNGPNQTIVAALMQQYKSAGSISTAQLKDQLTHQTGNAQLANLIEERSLEFISADAPWNEITVLRDSAAIRSVAHSMMNCALMSESTDRIESVKNAVSDAMLSMSNQIGGHDDNPEFESPFDEALACLRRRLESGLEFEGIPTGYEKLDRLIGGLSPTGLYILAGRPGIGKTAFALNLVYRLVRQGISVDYVSLEMSNIELARRLISIQTGIPDLWGYGVPEEGRIKTLEYAVDDLKTYPLRLDDSLSQGLDEVELRIAQNKPGLIVIDHLGLIASPRDLGSREQQVAYTSQRLKAIARKCKTPVLALSQLNRSVENRQNPEPRLSDLRDSGSIEQDADVAMFLWKPQGQSETRLSFIKNRGGIQGSCVDYDFNGQTQQFNEV